MATQITNSFITQYESEVHHIFQKRGAILGNTIRRVDGVVGSSAVFQKIGKGTATTKARHGVITPMNQTHTALTATLVDFYAGDWVDKLDEAKININERMALAQGGAWALGRKVDNQLFTVMTDTISTVRTFDNTGTGFAEVRNSLLQLAQDLDSADVPNDGQRYGALTPHGWAQSMTVPEFSSADFVGADGLPFTQGAPVHKFVDWLNIKWTVHSGCINVGTSTAEQFVWHKTAIGYATGAHSGNVAANQAVSADITWHGERSAHFVNHAMSGGAVLIDDTGVIQSTIDDTQSLPTD